MTECQIVLEVMVADCSMQLVQCKKMLIVRTLVVRVVACSGDCCRTKVMFTMWQWLFVWQCQKDKTVPVTCELNASANTDSADS